MRSWLPRRFSWCRTGAPVLLLAGLAVSCSRQLPVEQMVAAYQAGGQYSQITIRYPREGVVFPPEIIAPTFAWQEPTSKSDAWLILFEFAGVSKPVSFVSEKDEWTPNKEEWESIKQRTREQPAKVTVLGFQRAAPLKLRSRGQISMSTSKDPVGAPLFYREVNLPFMEAVKDPTRIRWRFGTIDTPEPPKVVLEHLPVCGNCHSFSSDGRVLGMDVDYANNKGSYIVTRVEKQMPLASSDIFTWDEYRREDRQQTFGLLSQVSPDGQTVVSTVKDKSVFVATPDLAFSQLFFPIKGILVVYHRHTGQFQALPGADDPDYVQSNPVWSPDGKELLFARAKAYQLKNKNAEGKILLSPEDCDEFLRDGKTFKFDLYRIPYNNGQGGKAEPVLGASGNGKSNYFPKYSPDGKWIIFCEAKSFMLLQPDSELYIIPAAGGQARRLRCNTERMNSWHSWSPNGHWLVFSSKADSPYTQLYLTHIDEQGESTPPVVLAHFTAPDRAANIPEFVNTQPGAIEKIQERFLDDNSLARAAYALEMSGEVEAAMAKYEQALAINPECVHAHQRLGFLLFNHKRQFKEGLAHTMEALRLDPADGCAHYDLGMALKYQGQLEPALKHLSEAVRLLPSGFDARYNPVAMRCALGDALMAHEEPDQAAAVYTQALSFNPTNAATHYLLAMAMAAEGKTEESLNHYAFVQARQPSLDTSPELHVLLASQLAKSGQMRGALDSAQRALQLARAAGNAQLADSLTQQIEEYRLAAAKK